MTTWQQEALEEFKASKRKSTSTKRELEIQIKKLEESFNTLEKAREELVNINRKLTEENMRLNRAIKYLQQELAISNVLLGRR